jgi:hypothetical protein
MSHRRFRALRTGGARGGSVENLKGSKGASFEGNGIITRGAPGIFGCCTGSCGHNESFLLVKGPFCFVFASINAPSPKYAIGLHNMQATTKPGGLSGRAFVVLEERLGDVDYEFSFQTEEMAKQFKSAIDAEAASAQVEAVRKRLGHENLLTKRASLVFAETIAKEKISDQPAAPVSTSELISAMTNAGV